MSEARFTTGPYKAKYFLIMDDLMPPKKVMPVFIELHDIDASEINPILINVNRIKTVETDSYSDNAVIYLDNGSSIPVNETYDEVKRLLLEGATK